MEGSTTLLADADTKLGTVDAVLLLSRSNTDYGRGFISEGWRTLNR